MRRALLACVGITTAPLYFSFSSCLFFALAPVESGFGPFLTRLCFRDVYKQPTVPSGTYARLAPSLFCCEQANCGCPVGVSAAARPTLSFYPSAGKCCKASTLLSYRLNISVRSPSLCKIFSTTDSKTSGPCVRLFSCRPTWHFLLLHIQSIMLILIIGEIKRARGRTWILLCALPARFSSRRMDTEQVSNS